MFLPIFLFVTTLILSLLLWGAVAIQVKKYKTMYNLPRKFLLKQQSFLLSKHFILLAYLIVIILSFAFFAAVLLFLIY